MIDQRVLSAAIFALLAGQIASAQNTVGLASTAFEPVRGGRLQLEVTDGGGKLEVLASDFYQQIRQSPGGRQHVRTLLPLQIQITASGSQTATFRAIPVDYGDGWFTKTDIVANLNQQSTVTIDPSQIDLGDFTKSEKISPDFLEELQQAERFRRAVTLCPLSVRIIEEHESEPVVEIRLGALPVDPPSGLSIDHTTSSKITETRATTSPSTTKDAKPRISNSERNYSLPIDVRIGGASGNGEVSHSNLLPPRLMFQDTEVRSVGTLNGRRILASGSATQTSVAKLSTDTKGGFADTKITATWRLAIGEAPDVAWLACEDGSPESWMPSFGENRRFAVHLKDPKRVEGIRLMLDQVSHHPGAAINAKLDQLAKGARPTIAQSIPVKLVEGETELKWNRSYRTFEESREDSEADLYFEQKLNPGFHLQGTVRSEGLPSPVSSAVIAKKVQNPTVVTVSVRDWAASGVIRGEVLVDGFWEPVQVKDPGAIEEGVAIHFPLDFNRNGIADAFEKKNASKDDDEDALSPFEEYRGAYVGGEFRRFSPERKDFFLIDYTNQLNNLIRGTLDQRFNPYDFDLHFIRPSEHSRESVGSSAGVYVIESLRINALPAVLRISSSESQARAWRALRPHPGSTSLFLDGSLSPELIANDLMRLWEFTPSSTSAAPQP
ncbi:MAG: hypothetical protein AAGH89_16860 [Verrucomicrobiota bacterium]